MREGSEGTATATGGPPRFFALLSHGGALLAGTCGRGIARSVDGGRTWAGSAEPAVVHALTAGSGSAAVLWAAGTGLQRSDDGGRSWDGAGLDGLTVYAVAAGADGVIVGTLARGVLRSLDGGKSWRGCDGPLSASTVYRLVRLPDGELLAATAGRGVWRVRVDRHLVGRPLVARPSGLDGLSVFALARLDGERILAGTREAGVYRSDDGGSTWTTSNSGLPDLVVHVLVSDDSGVVYAGTGRGVARSVDGGWSWERFGSELASHRIFSLMCVPPVDLFCGSYDGVWAWSGSGRWVPVDTGLSADDAYSVVVDRGGIAYAGTAAGALRSDDAGVTWTSAGVGGGELVYTVASRASGGFLAGTDDGVLAGRDGRWESAGLDHERVYCINEVAEGVVLAGTLGGGIWRGAADGGPWECTNDDRDMVLDIVCSRSGDVLVATGTTVGGVKSGGILRSRDLGITWEPADAEPMAVYRIVESSAGVLFAGGQRCKLVRSRDGGLTWSTLDTTGTVDAKMFGLAVDRADRLYLGAGAQLLISEDGAETWRVAGEGLDGATVFDVADHPSGALLAATSWGLFRSLDRGCSWLPS